MKLNLDEILSQIEDPNNAAGFGDDDEKKSIALKYGVFTQGDFVHGPSLHFQLKNVQLFWERYVNGLPNYSETEPENAKPLGWRRCSEIEIDLGGADVEKLILTQSSTDQFLGFLVDLKKRGVDPAAVKIEANAFEVKKRGSKQTYHVAIFKEAEPVAPAVEPEAVAEAKTIRI